MSVSPMRHMQIRALAERLKASCGGGETEDHDEVREMSQEECKVLDSMAFECTICNQWFGLDERSLDDFDEYVCGDCQ